MLSEWMLEVPDNFVDDWVMVPCPVGKRSLVIASNVCYFPFFIDGVYDSKKLQEIIY